MMHFRLLTLIIAASSVVVVDAQENFILNIISYLFRPLLDFFIRSTCKAIFSNFDDGFRLGCRCRGVYDDYFGGIGGKITCQIDDPFCLINRPFKIYCGEVDITATFNTRSGISKVKACIDITSNFPRDFPVPIDDVSQFPEACVSVVPSNDDFLTFESCEIKFDDQVCSSCVVCDSKRDFKFNCTNVNVNPAPDVDPTFIEGPFVTECIGFGFLFGTDPPTLAPVPTLPPFIAPVVVPAQSPITMPASPVALPVTPPAPAPANTTAPVPVNATAPSQLQL